MYYCQRKINDLPLGHRLHRAVSKGAYNDPDQFHPAYLCKTYITYYPNMTKGIWTENVNGVEVKFIEISHYKVKINGRTHDTDDETFNDRNEEADNNNDDDDDSDDEI